MRLARKSKVWRARYIRLLARFSAQRSNFPEVGMEEYRIEQDGDGFEVSRIQPDGKASFVGRFSSADEARAWIEDRVRRLKGLPVAAGKGQWRPRSFATQ